MQATSPAPSVRHVRIAVAVVACALAALMLAQALSRACREPGNDLTSYLLAGRTLLEGGDPYRTGSPFPYIYPLTLALMVAPLAALSCVASAAVWSALLLASLGVAWRSFTRERSPVRVDALGGALAFVVAFDVIQNNVVNGQVNPIVLAACVGGWVALQRGRSTWAALAFGFAGALKLFPLVVLAPLWLRGHRRVALGTLASAITWGLVPGLVDGVDLRMLYGEYFDHFLAARLAGDPARPGSVQFSVAGWLADAGVPIGATAAAIVSALVILAFVARDLVARRRRAGARFDRATFALYMIAPLLVVPMSQVHHLVMASPAVAVLLERAAARAGRDARAWLAASTLCYLVASLLWRDGPLYSASLLLLMVPLWDPTPSESTVAPPAPE